MTDAELNRKQLHETALKAPKSSGVYLWRNAESTIIYVGKAKNLKNRLSSYFAGRKDIKTRILVSKARSIEYITTSNEYEALLLENTLIKQHNPRYNINLKDGKSYPVLRITNEDFPKVFKTRRIVQDGSQYFGPFPNVGALDVFIESLYRQYKIRHCKKFQKRKSPCLYYHIGQCAAPCCGKISKENYIQYIEEIESILESEDETQIKNLEAKMKEAAKQLQFEKAARLRDGIAAIRTLREQNAVEDFDPESRDYVASHSEGPLVTFCVLKMRGGKLIARDCYRTQSLNEDDETTSEFLRAFYTDTAQIPPHIYVSSTENLELTRQFFSEILGANTEISTVEPGSPGEKRHLAALEMARQNAKEDIIRRMRERGDIPAMEELMHLLKLPTLPVRIEGFDIAHIGGKFPVASLISFYNGNPDKKNYRYFRLKTTDGIIDDFASMQEATRRRYSRLLREQAEMPDLIMIDGGIGQVNAVQAVLDDLGLDIPIVGLAERFEDLYLPHDSTPIKLPKRSEALRLLQRVRDETHRFATSKNQALRTKANTTLQFEALPNVGKARAAALLEKFKTIDELAVAEPEAVYSAAKCSIEQAKDIIEGAKALRASASAVVKDGLHARANAAKHGDAATSSDIAALAQAALEK